MLYSRVWGRWAWWWGPCLRVFGSAGWGRQSWGGVAGFSMFGWGHSWSQLSLLHKLLWAGVVWAGLMTLGVLVLMGLYGYVWLVAAHPR